MEKRAIVISCSDHYEHRMKYWDVSLRGLGFETTYVTTDFLHVEKKPYVCPVEGCVQLHVMPYRKNLSVQRILSHRMFARKVYRYLEEVRPQTVVSLLPPNFLVKYLAKYKKRHPEVKLILDIFDLWPETFPSSKVKKLLAPVFRVWANLRDKHLHAADFVTAECDMFRERLGLSDDRSETVYFSLEPYCGPREEVALPTDRADIAYLGSINNIIDISRIVSFLSELNGRIPTTLHVIGGGEKCEEFCDSVRAVGVEVDYCGKVFDETEKHRILSRCHFGLNVMKSSVCVGLTMKSVDYFRHGLPIVNTIPADTEQLIRERGIGVHVNDVETSAGTIEALIRRGVGSMKDASVRTFDELFSSSKNLAHCQTVLLRVLESRSASDGEFGKL
ncbi:MAG: glycosyltransferase [Clostridia bacterium]|nr:glycosyltransferase [Clostridia bacterium]